jgi:uncharacterized damage-inducible protein DinB
LRKFVKTWKEAKKADIPLPETDDPTYISYDTLLKHVFRWARGYMVWMCDNLGLPDPEINEVPEAEKIESEADEYHEHLLEKWKTPLSGVQEERFYTPLFTAPWNIDYCIYAMLEHAVMHPIRHRFQLLNLMER